MFPEYTSQTGIAQTIKVVVKNPLFARFFFKRIQESDAQAADTEVTSERRELLRTLLLAMIDHAAGAPGSDSRLEELAEEKNAANCAISSPDRTLWIASLMAAFGELAPGIPDKDRARIRAIYVTEVEHFIGLCSRNTHPS